MDVREAQENHVGLCGATVLDDVYQRDGQGRVVTVVRDGNRAPVVVGRERHRCSSMDPARCVRRNHVCSHGRGWSDWKSEAKGEAEALANG